MLIFPVAGSITAPWTKADCMVLASLQGPLRRFVAANWYGVANPCADSGLGGTVKVQSILTAAAAWVSFQGCATTSTPAPIAITNVTIIPMNICGEIRLRRRRMVLGMVSFGHDGFGRVNVCILPTLSL